MIGHRHDGRVVLHHQHGVALVAQGLQQFVHAVDIARVQPDAGLVENIHGVHQAAGQVLDDFDPLRLAARERVGGAVEAQILQADVGQALQALDQGRDDRRQGRRADGLDRWDQLVHLQRR